MSTEKRVLMVVEYHLGMPIGEVKVSDTFIDDIGCDSLDSIELLTCMEEEFDIEIDESLCESLDFKVSDAITLINSILI